MPLHSIANMFEKFNSNNLFVEMIIWSPHIQPFFNSFAKSKIKKSYYNFKFWINFHYNYVDFDVVAIVSNIMYESGYGLNSEL
jgi:hypothetical protein